jgi:hypothetical protein
MTVRSVPAEMTEPITRLRATQAIAELAYRMGHEVHQDRAAMLADDLAGFAEPPWSVDEFGRALRLIRMDPELAKEVTYDRTITARVFGAARERWAVRAGRPFDYDEACEACASERGLTFGELFDVARTADGDTVYLLRTSGAQSLDRRDRRDSA